MASPQTAPPRHKLVGILKKVWGYDTMTLYPRILVVFVYHHAHASVVRMAGSGNLTKPASPITIFGACVHAHHR
jgi:hypothetical protein